MTSYKNTEIGRLPIDWDVISTSQLLKPVKGAIKIGPFGSQLKRETFVEEGYKVYGQDNIINNDFSMGERAIRKSKFFDLKSCQLFPGDVVLTMMGTVGKCSIVPDNIEPGIMDSHLLRLQVNEKIYSKELLRILISSSNIVRSQIKSLSVGGIMEGLSSKIVSSLKFPCPPLSEQRAISDILSTVDEAITQSKSLVRKYQSIKQGLMSDLLTRGVDENGDIRDPEKFVETPIGNYPKTWIITSLGNLVLKNGGFIQTGPFGSQLHSYEYVEQGIPVVMPQDIMEDGKISEDNITRITTEKAKELSRHVVKPNDVVFARRGDLSRCSAITEHEVGWLCGTGSMLIRPPQKEIDGRWLAAVYRHEIGQHQIRARAVGSTMVNLNSTLLRDLIIPRPPLKEQAVIMEIIESQDKLLSSEVDNLAKLRLLNQGLMQDLLSGQVRVKV